MINIQVQLKNKLNQTGIKAYLSSRKKFVLASIANHPGCKFGMIALMLNIPNPTAKKALKNLFEKSLIEKYGGDVGQIIQ